MAPRANRNQLDNARLEVFRDITDDVVEADFVPYACLFDPDTVLTKNGELLQVIKITGFTYEVTAQEDADLRNVIRQAVINCIQSDEYAIWFHTIRRKKRLSPDAEYPDPFSAKLHDAWKHRNEWDRKYINELYITVVRESESAQITDVKGFFNGLLPSRDRKVRNAYLERVAVELDATVKRMQAQLKDFGAKRLTIVPREGVYYGEHIEFLEKLINLEERPMPIAEIGLSDYLAGGELSFAYNAMEVRTADGERRFGAVLTVKEYKEASLYRIDEILQLPCEFIVTQCIDFIPPDRALKVYEGQRYYMRVSGDDELAEESELADLINGNRNRTVDYCEQQTSLFVIGYSVSEMERSLKSVRDALAKIGIVTIREDLKFEECYWAQLPANFEFVRRLHFTHTNHVAGFVNIHNYPAGNAKGCPWGPPVTVFYTAAGTPYFFNFHLNEKGHATVISPPDSGKAVLVNFLVGSARKYRNRLFYLDCTGFSQSFITSIQGNYYSLNTPDAARSLLSPLSLPDSGVNREFLAFWLTTLVDPTGTMADDATVGVFKLAVAHIYGLPKEQRTLAAIAQATAEHNAHLASLLAPWYGEGKHACYFDQVGERAEPRNGIIAFDISALAADPVRLVPLASYLLHRMTMTLDGTPSIFVLDEAWKLFDTPLFSTRVRQWLGYLTSKNAFAIMTTEEVDSLAQHDFTKDLMEETATQIYLPNEDPDDEIYIDLLGLSEEEYAYLDAMNVDYRHFMIRRAQESVVAELNLGGMDHILSVLSGKPMDEGKGHLFLSEIEEEEQEEEQSARAAPTQGWTP